jgi:hypothetical protein
MFIICIEPSTNWPLPTAVRGLDFIGSLTSSGEIEIDIDNEKIDQSSQLT